MGYIITCVFEQDHSFFWLSAFERAQAASMLECRMHSPCVIISVQLLLESVVKLLHVFLFVCFCRSQSRNSLIISVAACVKLFARSVVSGIVVPL